MKKLFHKFSLNRTQEQSVFASVFTWVAVSFGLICVLGITVSYILDSAGVLKVLTGTNRFNWEIYSNLGQYANEALRKVAIVSIIGMFLIMVANILRLIWIFKPNVSRTFIWIIYAVFITGNGFGFGILFATWNAIDLIYVFGITSLLFGSMALVGWFAKNLSGWLPFLVAGTICLFLMSIINIILFFSGVYSDKFVFFLTIFSGILALAWTAFDVWWIKRTSQMFEELLTYDKEARFRLVTFFAYRLLTDYIWILWIVARLYLRSRH